MQSRLVAEKSLPPLRRRTSPSQHVFRNRRLCDIFLINPGPAAWIVRFPAPPGAQPPANDCLSAHDPRGVADIGETAPIQTSRTPPDHRRKAANLSEPSGADCSADGE